MRGDLWQSHCGVGTWIDVAGPTAGVNVPSAKIQSRDLSNILPVGASPIYGPVPCVLSGSFVKGIYSTYWFERGCDGLLPNGWHSEGCGTRHPDNRIVFVTISANSSENRAK